MKKILQLVILTLAFSLNAQVLELNPSNFSVTQPCGFTDFNNKLFYIGANATNGRELFSTDGTIAGNQLVHDIASTFYNTSYPGGSAFLLQSSAAAEGKIAKFNGKLYFEANDDAQLRNFKLWSTDGTSAGTQNIAPNLIISPIQYFKEFNGRLYFTSNGRLNFPGWDSTGNEVYSTDGTTAGTKLLKDINPTLNEGSVNINNAGFDPHFTVFNNRLYFIANDGIHGNEIWSTNGTEAGTTMLKDINTGSGGAFYVGSSREQYRPFVVFNDRMYFNAYNNNNPFSASGEDSLYSTDGTAAGTMQFQIPMPPNPFNDYLTNFILNVRGLTVANSKLYVFGVASKQSGNFAGLYSFRQGIYQTDGTFANTTLIKPFTGMVGISGYSEDSHQGSMREYNGEYYFLGSDIETSNQLELWKLNPVTNLFTKIVPLQSNGYSSFNSSKSFTSEVFDNKLYFVQEGYTPGIYSTNGTGAGSSLVAKNAVVNAATNIVASTQAMTQLPDQLKAFGNSLYFSASFDFMPRQLWRITNPSLKVTENIFSTLKVYPNPATSQINLSFDNNLEKANLKIISILGQTVLEKQNISGSNFSLDVSGLSMGTYIIQVKEGRSITTSKFIKQ